MDESAGSRRLIAAIMVGVAVWGAVLAVGAWRLNHDIRRMFVVAGCVAGFLGFWAAMLAVRAQARSAKTPADRG